MTDRWVTGVRLAETPTEKITTVPILPIGTFKLPGHSTRRDGKLTISEGDAAEMVQHFNDRTLKTDIRFDIEHDFREAAGWIRSLSVGSFEHAVTGEEVPGIIAEVEWTPVGVTALGERTYRYVSAAFGEYLDEETGVNHSNVLKAVALTNDPAMKMLPAVTLRDLMEASVLAFEDPPAVHLAVLEVDPTEELRQAVSATVRETFGDETYVTQWVDGGAIVQSYAADPPFAGYAFLPFTSTGDAPTLGELVPAKPQWTTELADGSTVTITTALAEDKDDKDDDDDAGKDKDSDADDQLSAEDLLGRFDELMEACESIVKGAAGVREMRALAQATRKRLAAVMSSKGGKKRMSDGMKDDVQLAELQAERDDALTKLAKIEARDRKERAERIVTKLSEKGLDEASRDKLFRILTSDGGDVCLTDEGDETVDVLEAVADLADGMEFAPVELKSDGKGQPNPDDGKGDAELSDTRKEVQRQLRTGEHAPPKSE